MSRPNPFVLTVFLAAFVALFGGFSVLQGGLYLDAHEGDSYHHLEILYRMAEGQRAHFDFMTPLGILAFLPVSWLMEAGQSAGMAFLWAQLAVASVLLLPTVYAAQSRLPRRAAYVFGAFTLGLAMALTYGGPQPGVSISMHYNRWAWSATFIVLALVFLPSRGRSIALLDGVFTGALMVAILATKITFFVALMPPILLALFWKRQFGTVFWAIIGGLAVLGALTVHLGVDHWQGYFRDLMTALGNEVRPFVGVPLNDIVAGPRFIGGTIVGILAVLVLRHSEQQKEGIILLVLLGAFFYITYQNFGNDPKWLMFLPFALVALRPAFGQYAMAGVDLSDVASRLTVAAVALFLPSFVNLALSPLSHAGAQTAKFLPMLPETQNADIFIRADRAHTMTAERYLDETSSVWSRYSEDAGRGDPIAAGGVTLEHCEIFAGSRAHFVEIVRDLEQAGIPDGTQILAADVLSSFWLFSGFAPLQGGAPWYYGNLSGLENADYVLVPKCPFLSSLTRIMLRQIDDADISLTLERASDLYLLLRPEG